jgi:hypothetical protein
MAELTPRLGLYKPADDGSEPLNVATDLNDNLEKIDATIGAVPATVATPPPVVYNGMLRQNTDDQSLYYFRNNTTWTQILSKGATFAGDLLIGLGNKIGINVPAPGAAIDAILGNAADILARFKVTGDTQPRVQLESTGLKLGPGGATVPDVRLYRQNAATLNITGNVVAENNLQVNGTPSFTNGITVTGQTTLDGDTNLTGGADIEDHVTFEGFPIMVGQRGTTPNVAIGAAATSGSQNISFGRTYPTAPTVVIGLAVQPGGSIGWGVRALVVTTTGFQAFYSGTAPGGSGITLSANWAAFHEGV